MKKYLLMATALAMMVSCSENEFMGETAEGGNSNAKAISFGSNAGSITRATTNTGTVSQMLDGQFLIYGTKNVPNNNVASYSTVFPNYVAWNNSSLTASTSNPDAADASKGWEYVGASSTTYGTSATTLGHDQTIKYWDYSAANYHFVAGSPVANFTYTITSNDIASATVSGLGGHINANPTSGDGTALSLNPVYIAKPVTVLPANYNSPVTFEFVRQQARVRVGVYETIPGYKITNIKFYPYDASAWGSTSSDNIILATNTEDYFVGGADDCVKGTITYTWTGVGAPTYSFSYDDVDAVNDKKQIKQKNWYGGAFNYTAVDENPAWEMAITSSESDVNKLFGKDKDRDANGYFTVLPTPSATEASPLLIKCDYVLEPVNNTTEGSDETITIHGATAAVPAAYSKWAPNTSYTYLFKISDNTNGKTNPDKENVGLYPITFDAVATADDNGQGYITTVTMPSIITYQAGSVTATGIKYVTGKPIYLTVKKNETGALQTLYDGGSTVGAVQVYSLGTDPKTEADMQVSTPTGTDLFDLGSSATTVDHISFEANKYGTFTPTTVGYYAIRYQTESSATYAYKVVHVE